MGHARPVRAGAFNVPPTFCPSLAAKARGGRGGCVVHDRETGVVEVGRISYSSGGGVVKAGCGSWAVTGWVTLSGWLGVPRGTW